MTATEPWSGATTPTSDRLLPFTCPPPQEREGPVCPAPAAPLCAVGPGPDIRQAEAADLDARRSLVDLPVASDSPTRSESSRRPPTSGRREM